MSLIFFCVHSLYSLIIVYNDKLYCVNFYFLVQGATIVDMAVIITPATNYQLPAAVLADLEVEPCYFYISDLHIAFSSLRTPNTVFALSV